MAQEFKLFRWLDLLTFGGVCSIPTAALVYALFHGLAAQTQGLILMIIVTAAFWANYVAFLVYRQSYLSKITFVTKQGVAIITNGFEVKQDDVEKLIDQTISTWNAACNFDKSAETLEGVWVEFKAWPITLHTQIGTFAGVLIGSNAVVGYKADLLQTAFQHELGHKIHHEFTGLYDNDACHKFMSEHNLP